MRRKGNLILNLRTCDIIIKKFNLEYINLQAYSRPIKLAEKRNMMSENNKETRTERHKSRTKSTLVIKLIFGLLVLVLLIFVLDYFIGGSDDNPDQDMIAGNSNESSMIIQSSDSSEEVDEDEQSDSESDVSSDTESESEEDSDEPEEGAFEVQEVNTDDPNVIRAFVGEWPPIGTSQGEPHVTNYETASADRLEIKAATALALGIPESEVIENWIGNNGEQRVTATITEASTGIIYKVYHTWVPGKGWQPTRYEELRQIIR